MPEQLSLIPLEHPRLVRGPGDQLVLLLKPLAPVLHDRGDYGGDGDDDDNLPGDFIPKRYRFLHKDAADALLAVEMTYPGVFYYTDIFRNANGSRGRRVKNREKRIRKGQSLIYTGKKPGFSAHSYGLCFDLEVNRSLKNLRRFLDDPEIDKADLDAALKEHGWWCHRDGPVRGDHKRGSEDWHFNFLGDDPDRWLEHSHQKTSGGVEAKVKYLYGPFTLDPNGVVEHLTRLGYAYPDEPRGVQKFQEDWTLAPDGVAGPTTQRTLLYIGAELRDADGGTLVDPPRFP